jgi:hypothetical protein
VNTSTTAPAWPKLRGLPGFKNGSGDGQYTACCPSHEDRRASLSIGVTADGSIGLTCHAGCDTSVILRALGCELRDLFPPRSNGHQAPKPHIEKAYDYCNEAGGLLYQAVRFVPKDFKQRRPDGRGGWDWSLKNVRRVPYRIPQILADASGELWIFEGEKDADRAASLGLCATTTAQGAESFKYTAEAMRSVAASRTVYIVPDADDAGDVYAQAAEQSLRPVAASVRVVRLPRLTHSPKHGEDFSDWLDRYGGTVDELCALADSAQEQSAEQAPAGEADDEDSLNTSRVADWPDPMAEAAYIGPVGRLVMKLAPETEAAPEAILLQGLAAAGNAMGRHAHFAVEADLHHTNIFVVIVGGTGARKGVSQGHVRHLLRRADETWESEHIINGLSSGEGLINAVRDEEPLIPDKVALAFESEFAAVFKVKGRDGNTLSTVLRQAFDGETLRSLTKNTPLKATGTHISITGHITPDELRRLMNDTDANNGFANRFLWVCAKRARYLPDGGNEVNVNNEVTTLHEAIQYGRAAGRLKRDAEAKALWGQRYRELSSGRPGLLGAVTNRAAAQVTRLSLIYALLDKSPDIKKKHLEAALAVWDYCLASARFIFGAALGDALAEDLDAELAKHGAEGMSRTEIYNHFSNNRTTDEIQRALGVLAGQSRAEKRRVKGAGGRAIDRWYSLTYNANNVNNGNSEEGSPSEQLLDTSNTLFTYPTKVRPDTGDTGAGEDEPEDRRVLPFPAMNTKNAKIAGATGTDGRIQAAPDARELLSGEDSTAKKEDLVAADSLEAEVGDWTDYC